MVPKPRRIPRLLSIGYVPFVPGGDDDYPTSPTLEYIPFFPSRDDGNKPEEEPVDPMAEDPTGFPALLQQIIQVEPVARYVPKEVVGLCIHQVDLILSPMEQFLARLQWDH
ncbi:hypothetical protein RJT34_17022 [Clitoria ternatea]|uniref:Uncharacterized protein n=1 Tax=Clitoria ternatea TaxID=43366 RepID=A0AAN9PE70_CLITE